MTMLKIGDRIINTDAIAHIDLNAKWTKGYMNPISEEGVKITMLSIKREDVSEAISVSSADTLFFTGEEASALRLIFSYKKVAEDLIEIQNLHRSISFTPSL